MKQQKYKLGGQNKHSKEITKDTIYPNYNPEGLNRVLLVCKIQ